MATMVLSHVLEFLTISSSYLRLNQDECNRICSDSQSDVAVFHRVRPIHKGDPDYTKGFRSKLEISIGEANGNVPDDVWIQEWRAFCKAAVSSIEQ